MFLVNFPVVFCLIVVVFSFFFFEDSECSSKLHLGFTYQPSYKAKTRLAKRLTRWRPIVKPFYYKSSQRSVENFLGSRQTTTTTTPIPTTTTTTTPPVAANDGPIRRGMKYCDFHEHLAKTTGPMLLSTRSVQNQCLKHAKVLCAESQLLSVAVDRLGYERVVQKSPDIYGNYLKHLNFFNSFCLSF